MKSSVVLALVGAFCVTLLSLSTPANAQATRTWVSGVGDDANPCSVTAPCKTFAGAISKTASPGEINCLTPGGFGAVTITKAITISCEGAGVTAGVLVSGTNGITVSAGATAVVYLSGLDFEGVGSGLNGVQVTSAARVYIVHCTIRDFTQNGVNVVSSTAGTNVVIKDSVIENNAGGVNVQGNGVANVSDLFNTLVDGNSSFGVQVNTSNTIALVNSIVTGSPNALSILGTGSIVSFGPSNVITGGASTPTSSVTFK
jgi:hypothetical protein